MTIRVGIRRGYYAAVVAALAALMLVGACAKKSGRETAAKTAADPAAAFAAKTAAVDKYMASHNAANTPKDVLRRDLENYARDFETLGTGVKGSNPALAARCWSAAESLRLFAHSLTLAENDPRALDLAARGDAQWREAKSGPAPAPRPQ